MRYHQFGWNSLWLCLSVVALPGMAQSPHSLLTAHRSLIDPAVPAIQGEEYLASFFDKLEDLEEGEHRKVHIAHIGDSHVQADYLPGVLREAFWRDFGCAGRGLVYPYTLAETHGPLDYHWSSTSLWMHRRRTFQREGPPIGLAGMGIQGKRSPVSLEFFFEKEEAIPFDRVRLFGDGRSIWSVSVPDAPAPPLVHSSWTWHEVAGGETLHSLARRYNCTVTDLQSWNQLYGALIHPGQRLRVGRSASGMDKGIPLRKKAFLYEVEFPEPKESLRLEGHRTDEAGQGPSLFGLSLEQSTEAGILYHMVGVNGTTYYHFHHADLFLQQLEVLRPDLVIVTLGTNEALQERFPEEQIQKEVSGFLRKLKKGNPGLSILVMTNSDAGSASRTIRTRPGRMAQIVCETALEEGAAVFDWYRLMGGQGSVYTWRDAGLVYRDFIHFTKKGYIFQGAFLYEALMNTYHDRN